MPQNYFQTISKPINTLFVEPPPVEVPFVDTPPIDTEYIILENIYNYTELKQPLRQRDLAMIAGASLGMTNSILKRLAQKGWITIKKLNSRNFQYAVTMDGINEIIRRSYSYFKRTIRNIVIFKDILEDLVFSAKHRNINTVILVGPSDLDFIVEHACRRWGMRFISIPEEEKSGKIPPQGTLKIYAENIPEINGKTGNSGQSKRSENNEPASRMNIFYLSRLIIKQAAAAGSEDLEI